MTADLKTWRSEGSGTTLFKYWKKRTVSPLRVLYLEKYPSEMKGKLRHSQVKKTKRICCQQKDPKRIAKGMSLTRKKVIKQGKEEQKYG